MFDMRNVGTLHERRVHQHSIEHAQVLGVRTALQKVGTSHSAGQA